MSRAAAEEEMNSEEEVAEDEGEEEEGGEEEEEEEDEEQREDNEIVPDSEVDEDYGGGEVQPRRRRRGGGSSALTSPSSSPPLTSIKSSRRRMAASTISAATGGKPKFRLNEPEDDDDEEDEEDEEELPVMKKRVATFGNSNTTAAETFAQTQQRPFKDLDVAQRLKVVLKAPADKGKSAEAAAATAPKPGDFKINIPAPVASSKTASLATATSPPPVASTAPPASVYIRFQPEWLAPHDYMTSLEDETWLKNSVHCASVSPELFEKIINQLELMTGTTLSVQLNAPKAFAAVCQPLSQNTMTRQASDEVFQYWISKRNKLKRSLLRRFWPQTTDDDRSPTATFRVREFERTYKLRRKKVNDLESYEKLQLLRKDFARLSDLVGLVEKRETLKKLEFELVFAEYREKLATASGGASLPRPACLDVALPALSELEPMESAFSYADLGERGGTMTRYRPKAPQSAYALPSAERKKSHKRRQPGEDGFVAPAIQPVGVVANPIPYYFPEALYMRDDAVPLPLYLLDDPRVLREDPYRPVKLSRLSDQPNVVEARIGRNRRRLVAAPPEPEEQEAFEPSPSLKAKIDALLSKERPGEVEVIERVDLALLRVNEIVPPKFQLLV